MEEVTVKNSDKMDFVDYLLTNMDEHGHFISILVSNDQETKRLVIENGLFYVLLSDYKFDKQKYRDIVRPAIDSGKVFKLNKDQWDYLSSKLLDTADYFTEKEYSFQLNKYFKDGDLKDSYPNDLVLRKLAHSAFKKEYYFYRDGELGPWHIRKYEKE